MRFLFACVLIVFCGSKLCEASEETAVITTTQDFDELLNDEYVALILVTSSKSPESVEFGSTHFLGLKTSLQGKVNFAIMDRDEVPEIASEFNIRKHHVPKVLVLDSRARSPTHIKAKGATDVHQIVQEVNEALANNEMDDEGKFLKTTLALGGGEL
ncbi:hypothetical protein CYMTET_10942 [Cymbomonas tetramitiformis]|uniref:Uncharacterized protein n=1 Tax=Cymbomonas tetramitiformis TaxID=36881 RepID=A0AAE0GNB0_9CHLO|nr:hypothetical protein CYMTET_10942 [Cymbomonas tetramitiformis]